VEDEDDIEGIEDEVDEEDEVRDEVLVDIDEVEIEIGIVVEVDKFKTPEYSGVLKPKKLAFTNSFYIIVGKIIIH